MFKRVSQFFKSKVLAETDEVLVEGARSALSKVDTDERPIVKFGMMTLAIGFGGFLLWAALAPLDEGVPGVGVVSVDTKRKTVQHLHGGVVEEILVREGARVKAGDILVRLNSTDVKAQLDIAQSQLYLAAAMEARLRAERANQDKMTFPDALQASAQTDPRAKDAIDAQSQLFSARRAALKSELATMDQMVAGLNNQITGLRSLEAGKKRQIELLEKELTSYRGLAEEGFVPRNKLYEQERVLADISGTRGSDIAQIARAEAAINETRLRQLQRQQDYRKEVESQMSDVQRELNTRTDQLRALEEQYARTDIKAPADGYVVAMEAHTVGGVVRPGDRIMDIVPEDDVLVVEAQLPVNLIDKVRVGQLANMHLQIVLSGGAQPVIEGEVVQISADRLTDQRTGAPYYSARIHITAKGAAEVARHKIHVQPGMQADVVVITGARTLLQYLMRPLMSRITSGMTEL